MSTDTLNVPTDAGLPPGGPQDGDGPTRDGDDLITAAAGGGPLSEREKVDLLDYFVANGQLPGDAKPKRLEFTIGSGPEAVSNVWQARRIGWEEWFDAQQRATDDKTGQLDGFIAASYVVARALIDPKLGPVVNRQQQLAERASDKKIDSPEGRIEPPADSAMLLRRMFRKQGGVLLELSSEIRRHSKLTVEGGSVRTLDEEVAAGEA